MSPLGLTLITTLAVLFTVMTAIWLVSVKLRDASIIDPCWGLGFVVAGWVSLALNPPASPRMLWLAGLTSVWGLRLSIFLMIRNFGHGEDRRYTAMREHHGARFWWVSLFTVFWLQAAILWFIAWPLQAAAASEQQPRLGLLDGFGAAIWIIGLLFETVGDWQLARFKADPGNAGRVMDRGLWRYTRHPNYFGDCCVWWGLYLIAAAGGAGWTIASPLLMTVLLLKVSGVTLLERTIVERRPEYAAYQARTSPFFPWPPGNAASQGPP